MNLRSVAALAIGLVALLWIVHEVGFEVVGRELALAGWVLPFIAAVHLAQLFLSAEAWRAALGDATIRSGTIFRVRWIREGVNALLPVAQIGGPVVGARLLTRLGVMPVLATAGTILDLTLEAGSQLVFTLAGIGVLLALRPNHDWFAWIGGGLALTALGVTAFVVLQRLGALRLAEMLISRLAASWTLAADWSIRGLHAALMKRQNDHAALLRALLLHTASWALGGAEVWIVLTALDQTISPLDAVVIESLGMAARSAGFAVPAAIGVQEGGFVWACGMFGVPAEAAVALSVLKRLREALVGVPALAVWQRARTKPAKKLPRAHLS